MTLFADPWDDEPSRSEMDDRPVSMTLSPRREFEAALEAALRAAHQSEEEK